MVALAPTLFAIVLGGCLGLMLVRATALAVAMVVYALAGTIAALAGGGWWFFLAGCAGPLVGLQLAYFFAALSAVVAEDAEAKAAPAATKPSSVHEDGAPA